MSEDDDLKTVTDVMDEWGATLPANHAGRILLAALCAMEEGELAHRALEGPEDPVHPVWHSILTLGTTADGALRYFLYPAARTVDDLRDRDTLLAAIEALPEAQMTVEEALRNAGDVSKTLAMAYYGRLAEDGTKLLGLAWHPGLTYQDAVGQLKLAIRYVRESEANAAKGGS